MNNQEATLTNQIIALINETTSDITSINTILNSVSLHFTPPSSSVSDTHSDTTVYNQLTLPVNNHKRKVGRLSLVGCGNLKKTRSLYKFQLYRTRLTIPSNNPRPPNPLLRNPTHNRHANPNLQILLPLPTPKIHPYPFRSQIQGLCKCIAK